MTAIERVAAVEAIEKAEEEIALVDQAIASGRLNGHPDYTQLMLGLALAHGLLAIETRLAELVAQADEGVKSGRNADIVDFLAGRLVNVYDESPNTDYILHARSLAGRLRK